MFCSPPAGDPARHQHGSVASARQHAAVRRRQLTAHGWSRRMISRQPRAVAELRRRVVDGPGRLSAAVRRQAFSGGSLAPELMAYAEKIRSCAYQVTEQDVTALKEAGYTEDQIFELTVSLALAAGMARLDAGLTALGGGG